MSHPPVRLVLTGAPGSGKTSVLNLLAANPAFSWLTFLPELARHLLNLDPTYRNRWDEFHLELYKQQVEREHHLQARPFVTDRGTVDAFGFHPESLHKVGSTLEREYARYTQVLMFETSAHLGASYYQMDTVRQESIEDALAIERALIRAWGGHPNYMLIPATPDFEQKCRSVVTLIRGLRPESEHEMMTTATERT